MSRRDFIRFAMVISFLVMSAAGARAQQLVIYDWSSDATVPESYPRITRRQAVTFRITNVNDILFTYRLEITQTPIATNDFGKIAALLGRVPSGGKATAQMSTCEGLKTAAENLTSAALDKLIKEEKLPLGYAKASTQASVPLKDSVNAWNALLVSDINEAMDAIGDLRGKCPNDVTPALKDFEHTVEELDKKVNGPHVFEDTHLIDPGNDVTAKVIEEYNKKPTKTKTFSFPGVDVLTLSAGALFSRIPDRTYEARKSPGSDLNLLTVEGNSRATPSLVALLNYNLGLDYKNFGLALSAGPVLKLANQSEASSFGFFAGLSTHFRERFFITPGVHFGQFADFPVGFGNGSTVPANFGELTPVKRWTAKFALALTFKTPDFNDLGSDAPKVTGTAKKADTGTTSSSGTSSSSDVAASFLRVPSRRPAPEVIPEVKEPAPVAKAEPTVPTSSTVATIIPETRQFVSATAPAAMTHLNSITRSLSSDGERVALTAPNPIRDYRIYFRNGRFFLSLPHTRLDVFQDGLSGQSFTDPVFEQHGDECVVSFALTPGTRARVEELASGLAVIFMPAGNN